MRSIAYWVLEDYSKALDTLLEQPSDNSSAGATFGEHDAGKSYFFQIVFLFPSLGGKNIQSPNCLVLFSSISVCTVVTFKSYGLSNAVLQVNKVESFVFTQCFRILSIFGIDYLNAALLRTEL